MKRLSSLVAAGALVVAGLVGSISTASAGPRPTPNGYCGARNMAMAGDGMANAMSRDNENGNLGMFHAVAVSSC
jgi:hypothetical protein